MRSPWVCFVARLALATAQQVRFSIFQPSTEIRSTNLTDMVQWDGYSMFVLGQRLILWSGEIHPWRILTPALYLDVMQRIKALGFNAISMYTFWGLHNPAPGVLDFDDWKNLDPFFEAANEAGLWVVARPGPYINAEVAGGGIPGWVTALNVSLRTSDPVFREAYEPYWQAVGEIFAKHQITNNGSIIGVQIDNEYFLDNDGSLDLNYIQTLEALMRDYGIVVPLTFNDVGKEYRLVEGKGAVDIYGVDSYPQNTDCSDPTRWKDVQTSYRQYFEKTSGKVGSPFYIPEFQGGWIPGIDTKGFDKCQALFDSEFQRIFYHSNIAQGVRMHNVYMIYGGTNFGQTAFPRGITTYDYWAAIAEDRSLRQKYRDLKSMSHSVRSARDLSKTWNVDADSDSYTTAPPGVIRVDELRNPDTQAGYYVVRHENSSSLDRTFFDIKLNDQFGHVTAPMVLDGRDSQILVTNYRWGQSNIAYSSALVFTSMTMSDKDILILHGNPNQTYQVAFPNSDASIDRLSGTSRYDVLRGQGRVVVTFTISPRDHTVLQVKSGSQLLRAHILDTAAIHNAWEAVLPSEGPFGAHYGVGSNATVLVFGPYFLRSAKQEDNGVTLHLEGDLSTETPIDILAPISTRRFKWNGKYIYPVLKSNMLWSVVLPGPKAISEAPNITNWKWADSLPELSESFDDTRWSTADRLYTTNPNRPYPEYTGKYVLFLQDYGYAVGNTILRGHFTASGRETGFEASVSAGTGGAAAFWLNGHYLGSALVDKEEGIEDANVTLAFPSGTIRTGDNVLLIVLDNAAVEENNKFTAYSSDIQSPRGIRGYTLQGGDISGLDIHWKVQGNLGGWLGYPDRMRSIYNAGGLAGERKGWHLPDFDDSRWNNGLESLSAPGVRFYRANLEIDYPQGIDIHYSIVFPNSTGAYRAQLYINGWQLGRRYGDYGPQTVFPVPPGVLVQGRNCIALSLFAMNETEDSRSIGGSLTVRIDPDVTTSALDLAAMRMTSPSWKDIYIDGVGE